MRKHKDALFEKIGLWPFRRSLMLEGMHFQRKILLPRRRNPVPQRVREPKAEGKGNGEEEEPSNH